jgi:uncharacterized membrane protein YkoI
MTSFRNLLLLLAAAASLSLGAAVPAWAQAGKSGNCLTDQQIQAEIASGQIQSWPSVKRTAGISGFQEVSDVRVCLVNGVPFYQVNVVSPNGEAKKVRINAVNGGN